MKEKKVASSTSDLIGEIGTWSSYSGQSWLAEAPRYDELTARRAKGGFPDMALIESSGDAGASI